MAAVWSWQTNGTTWADDTEQTVFTGAYRITKIEVYPNDSQSAIAYLDLWDATNPNPGTTTPTARFPIPPNTTKGLQRKVVYVIPNGGLRMTTACTALCNTDGGETAVATTTIPKDIKIYYTQGN